MFSSTHVVGAIGFLAVFALIMLAGWALPQLQVGERRVRSRLRMLANESDAASSEMTQVNSWGSALSRLGALFVRSGDASVENLRTRLTYAGYFQPMAPMCFVAAQLLTTVGAGLSVGLAAWWFTAGSIKGTILWASAGAALGFLLPSYWLAAAGKKRQGLLKRGLADALDVLVLCMDGGMNLNAAMQLVTEELDVVHPELASEFTVVHREMQMGLPVGQALRTFADRCGLNDVRDLASIILQSENLGAGLSKTLRSFADSYRVERQQKAEETAQKASVKILFPMLLCIFPAIFIVLLGPAALQLTKLFQR